MENIKLLFQLYYRPAAAMGEIIDRGSWLSAAILMLIVSFAFQYAVSYRIAETYAVSKMDYYLANSNFKDENFDSGRLTSAQLEEAEYLANMDIENEMKRERRPLPVVGKNALYFVAFDSNFFTPLISLSVFYVPLLIILTVLLGGLGRIGLIFQRDYGTLSTCAMLAWTAAHLPFAVVGVLLYSQSAIDGAVFLTMWLASSLLFGVLMIFALRTVLGANYGAAIAVVSVSWLAFSLGIYVFRYVSPFLFSPFLLFYAVVYLGGFVRGEARGFGNAFRQRQNFKRFLHNATVNPKDADAHVQLGSIYLQRRQEAKALEHFNKAVEIDGNEIDANYELGKLARAKSDFQAALNHFSIVIEQNDKYALSEVWREIGATYLGANMPNEAREALEKFVTRRPVDSEGLYYLGKVLKMQGNGERAREMFEQAMESAKNSPDYRRRELKYWSKLAQKEI
jgi:tetratricopeptide (TPR) repeat protein